MDEGKQYIIRYAATLRIWLFILFVLLSGTAQADDLSDVLGGFDEEPFGSADDNPEQSVSNFFHISGSANVTGAFNLSSHHRPPNTNNRRGLAKLRGETELTCDLNLGDSWRARITGKAFYDTAYSLRNRDHYTSQTLDAYEHEGELEDVWLQGSLLPQLDMKIGRQIVVWGKSDNIRVTDILNPMDKREPGMTNIRDLRLPVTMTRLDYNTSYWTMTGIVVHEVRFDKRPVYGSDYYTSSQPLPAEEKPGVSFDNQEFAFALNGIFSGWEASFYAARVFDDTAHMGEAANGEYKRIHARISMAGMAINLARGNWLYKTEAAFFNGLKFATLSGEKKSRLDMLIGVEYSGLTDTTISFELANRHIFGFEDKMAALPDSAEEDDLQWALRVNRYFFHERLEAVFLAQIYDTLGQGGAVERIEATYDLTDNWELTAGFVFYQSGNKASFTDSEQCNRLFFRLHYAF